MFKNYDLIVVGAGLFGSVVSEQASRAGYNVCVVEQRNHIGGNCYTEKDPETDIIVHKYGPHIFHTDNKDIWEYINQFTEFNNYVHKAKSSVGDRLFSIPINLSTVNQLTGAEFRPAGMREWLDKAVIHEHTPRNFEEQALALVGKRLYDAFIKGYTQKQWGVNPKELPASVARRLPVRTNYNDRYYNDRYEGIPVDGYTPIFEKMLSHPNITVMLNTDWNTVREHAVDKLVVYTGAIDRYYDYQYGDLKWRTLDFQYRTEEVDDYQGVTQINYPEQDVPWTREIEHKHFHPERKTKGKTIIGREFSRDATRDDTPYYPVKTEEDMEKYSHYSHLANTEKNVIFGGRLGEYMYYDMHQVIGSALACYRNKISPKLAK